MDETIPTALCCELACELPAEWVLTDGPAPDDYTLACTGHVGALLKDGTTSVEPV